ncbi:unnamed protein product [Brachionus calyciflorus]|uniref:Nuclear receptor n=1 Tax=Brachionus calyciflorus TaxID=104777 RepID=A0A813S9Q4_9BILA|nr:unnamed protein product [Brachionus calyciflorus]
MPLFLESNDQHSLNLIQNRTDSIEKNPCSLRTYGNCTICHEKATGFHYGVLACNGCKSFFKRSVKDSKKYFCHFDLKCASNPKRLKRCRYCRWNSCLKAGMCLNERRNIKIKDSLKKNKDIKILENQQNINTNQIQSYSSELSLKTDSNQIVVFDLLKHQSYQLYMEHSKEFQEINLTNSDQKYNFTKEFIKYCRQADLRILKNHSNSMLKIIKELPGFNKFKHNDFKAIMSLNFFTILGLRTLNLFINNDYFFMLDEKVQMNREVFSVLFTQKVCDFVFNLFFKLKSLNLTGIELGLLVPFFMSSISDEIESQEIIREVSEYYRRALFHEFNKNKRSILFFEQFLNIAIMTKEMNKMVLDVDLDENDLSE